ncbi:hypothetical protein [Neorhodopirellula pilleata]|uniref:Uncharacterized protein n=1 Tax=Neorhodopirellula pilleata TaxID=2714738 RepID=A0A5C6AAV5_9BACT|nr:hypothetical protein [Neorhodopirellula pilleata]TWT97172.1 hypothetical protein Pla100_23210 [Neorhodopirellula pilleata]
MKQEDQKRLYAAVRTMRDMQSELEHLSDRTDQKSAERRAELIDELMTMSMGIGPLRKQMATKPPNRDSPIPSRRFDGVILLACH